MPTVIPITDPDDPRIAAFRDVRERDLVGREGRFMAEGETVLKVLAGTRLCATDSVLLAEKRVAGLMPVLAGLPDEVPVYAASDAVIGSVIGFPLHRGILAIGRRAAVRTAEELLAGAGRHAMVLVLVGIANHDNVGGIFRNAAAFGADAVLLDTTCCDPLYRKAIRVSVGATLIVPWARIDAGADVPALLDRHGFGALALSPNGSATLAETMPPDRVAILLGTEGPGLPAALLDRVPTVRIPMAAGFNSLNVATTSGIVLHHCRHDVA